MLAPMKNTRKRPPVDAKKLERRRTSSRRDHSNTREGFEHADA